jgi:site-specific recombinase XerD
MKNLPPTLVTKYNALLKQNGVPDKYQRFYFKWLRFYLDFCQKYQFDDSNPQSLPKFIEKLKEKKQTEASQKQARSAIRIYYSFIQSRPDDTKGSSVIKPDKTPKAKEHQHSYTSSASIQKAIKRAVNKVKLCKRATAHTFRHSYASHLLQENYDIRTIQELMGHSDIRTTMIYTHTVKSKTIKEARSPLDFE